jgi:hypothetical protein
VILYSPEDLFRVAALAVGDVEHCPVTKKIRPKVFTMIRYCHSRQCRRLAFQQALEGSQSSNGSMDKTEGRTCLTQLGQSPSDGEATLPSQLCDNCQRLSAGKSSGGAISSHEEHEAIQQIFERILEVFDPPDEPMSAQRSGSDEHRVSLTLIQLMKTSQLKSLMKNMNKWPSRHLPVSSFDWQWLIVSMIERSFLDLHIHFTPYSSLCYIVGGDRSLPLRTTSPTIALYLQNYFLKFPVDTLIKSPAPAVLERKEVELEEEYDEIKKKPRKQKEKKESGKGASSAEGFIDLT